MSKVNKKLERLETLVNFIIDIVYPKYPYRVVFGPKGVESIPNVVNLREFGTGCKVNNRGIRIVMKGDINDIGCKPDVGLGVFEGIMIGEKKGDHIGVSTPGKVISGPIAVVAKD